MEIFMGLLRHVLTFGGGYIVAQGFTTQSDWDAIAGGLATLIGLGWSIWHKTHPAA